MLPREAVGALGSEAGAWLQSASFLICEQKAAQEPVWQGAGSSSTTSVVILRGFIIGALIVTPQFLESYDNMK